MLKHGYGYGYHNGYSGMGTMKWVWVRVPSHVETLVRVRVPQWVPSHVETRVRVWVPQWVLGNRYGYNEMGMVQARVPSHVETQVRVPQWVLRCLKTPITSLEDRNLSNFYVETFITDQTLNTESLSLQME